MSMNQPLVTVLMPVFNAEQFLEESITSILNQTYYNFEFLIINDGSTDKSIEIIQGFTDERIRLVCLEKNGGIIAALNLGLELAKGDYLARIDADDIALPERLEKQVDFLEKNIEVGCLGTDFLWHQEHDEKSWINYYDNENIRVAMLFECAVCHPTIMMRMSIVCQHSLRYPRDYPHAEDYAFWLEISKYTQIVNLPEKLVSYRRHPLQISKVKSEIQCQSIRKIQFKQLRSLGLKVSVSDLILNSILGGAFVPVLNLHFFMDRWINKIVKANADRYLFHHFTLCDQLDQRSIDALLNKKDILSKMSFLRRIHWQVMATFRYIISLAKLAE